MACPYFYPECEVDFSERPRPARAPLGTVFDGRCMVDPAAPATPPPSMLYECCNFGYARGRCRDFPPATRADAVRFSRSGAEVIFILERAYSPMEYGTCDAGLPAVLARQARVYSEEHG